MTDFAALLEWLSTQLEAPLEGLLKELVRRLDYENHWLKSSAFEEIGEGRAAAVRAFIQYAKAFPSLAALLSGIDRLSNRDNSDEERTPAVSILTIHRAKRTGVADRFHPRSERHDLPVRRGPRPRANRRRAALTVRPP